MKAFMAGFNELIKPTEIKDFDENDLEVCACVCVRGLLLIAIAMLTLIAFRTSFFTWMLRYYYCTCNWERDAIILGIGKEICSF